MSNDLTSENFALKMLKSMSAETALDTGLYFVLSHLSPTITVHR